MSEASIHACKCSGCHIMAFEGDFVIYDEIMAPLYNDTTPNTSTNATHMISIDDDDNHVRKVAKHSCIRK